MGIKIEHISRNIKLEKELQSKIDDLMSTGKYDNVPMLFINAVRIKDTGVKVLLDISKARYHFVISRCAFVGNSKE